MLSAICFNLDHSKILSSVNGLQVRAQIHVQQEQVSIKVFLTLTSLFVYEFSLKIKHQS